MPVNQPVGAITRPFSGNSVTDVKFAPDGSLWVANGATLQRVDVVTGQVLEQFTLAYNILAFDISLDGQYVVGTANASQIPAGSVATLFRIDTQTDTVTNYDFPAAFGLNSAIGDVAFLSDGTVLLAQTSGALMKLLPSGFVVSAQGTPISPSPNMTDPTLFSSADNDTVFVIDSGITRPSYIFGPTNFTGNYLGSLAIIRTDIGVPDPYAGASLPEPLLPVGAISNDETRFAYGTALEIANAQLQTTTLLTARYPYLGAQGMVFSPAGDRLYVAGSGGVVVAFDTTTWTAVGVYPVQPINGTLAVTGDLFGGFAITNGDILQISDNGRYLAMVTTAGVQVIDLTLALPIADGGDNTVDEGSYQYGLGGNDTLGLPAGQSGYLYGGEGDDTYLFTSYGSQFAVEGANEGTDTILTTFSYPWLPDNIENLTFTGTGGVDLTGNSIGNTITGGSSDDVLLGDGGPDTVIGGDGADRLGGGRTPFLSDGFVLQDWDLEQDHDVLLGGNGDDTLWVDYGDDADGGAGTDTVYLSFGGLAAGVTFDTASVLLAQPYGLGGGTIQNVERFSYLFGTGFADTLTVATQATVVTVDTGDGNDTITANGSALLARGGNGDDAFFSGSAADTFDGGSGFDVVIYANAAAGISLTTGSFGTWTGAGGDQLTSIEKIVGSGFADTLTSGGGTVWLWGGGGNDTLIGGSGADQLVGMDGDDTIVLSNSVISGEIFEGDAGFDTLELRPIGASATSQYSFVNLPVFQVERLQFSSAANLNITASLLFSQTTSQPGGGQLTHVTGGSGLDSLYFHTGPTANGGTFEVPLLAFSNWAASGDIVGIIATLPGNYTLIAREGFAGLQSLGGNSGNDVLLGSSGIDFLIGGGGNDALFGFGGADTMLGGGGDDIYWVDTLGDRVSETAGQGRDIVYTLANYALNGGSAVEVLASGDNAATTALQLVGNELANELWGNAGANVLFGGGGADFMAGFGGDDTYWADNAGDVAFEFAGQGHDIVYTLANHALTAGSEVEVLAAGDNAATTALQLVGNEFANELWGSAGANVLVGGGGADFMAGFGGDDTYWVDNAGDVAFEFAGQGRDIVYALADYALSGGSEVEVLASGNNVATTALQLAGNELANELWGGAGANVLFGGGGADFMAGFGGDDTYWADNAGDLVSETAGQGHDIVYALADYALSAGSEVEVLAAGNNVATTALQLAGNELANELWGGAGANVLDGGAGADFLAGFGGADSFDFTSALGGGNIDLVADFQSGADRLRLDDAVFTGLTAGALAPGAFQLGTTAQDADDRILYDAASGALLFDADGNGAGAAIHFATLAPGTAIAAADIFVV